MLGRVFSSVFSQISRKLWMVCVLFAAISLISFLAGNAQGIIAMISRILQITVLILGVVLVFYAFLVCWVFFRNSFYQDQAFLYQTLPVKRTTLFYGELAAFVCWQIIVFVLLCAGLWYGMANQEIRDYISMMITDMLPMAMGSSANTWLLLILFAAACFEQLICEMIAGIFGICAGYSTLKDKLGKAVVIGIFSYYGLAAIMLGILFIMAKMNPDTWALLDSGGFGPEILPLLGWLAALYLVAIAILIGASRAIVKKGINID